MYGVLHTIDSGRVLQRNTYRTAAAENVCGGKRGLF